MTANRTGFSNKNRGGRELRLKMAAILTFVVLLTLAIGVPLLSTERTKIAPNPELSQAQPTAVPMVQVFVPLNRIPGGSPLSLAMFKKEQMNAIALSALGGAVIRIESEFIGRYAKAPIPPGRPLTVDLVGDPPENQLLRKIAPGFRAVTMKVDDVSGIEGWGAPGARVDVLWITQVQGDTTVSTIVKNVKVLSVAGRADPKPEEVIPEPVPGKAGAPVQAAAAAKPQPVPTSFTVTVLVSPEEGQNIILASMSGKLSLMLRGSWDNGKDQGAADSTSTKRLIGKVAGINQGAKGPNTENIQGTAKVKRDDGTYDEWSVIEGRVWRWGEGGNLEQ